MTIDEVRAYCALKKGVSEDFPFDFVTLVIRVGRKMFAILDFNAEPPTIALKCNPEKALFLRSQFQNIIPGYHLNKQHWNTVIDDGSIPHELLLEMVDDSYDLVYAGLTKMEKKALS